ncbi:hypothetical protein ACRRTK_024803 [Alexandromys fortis]
MGSISNVLRQVFYTLQNIKHPTHKPTDHSNTLTQILSGFHHDVCHRSPIRESLATSDPNGDMSWYKEALVLIPVIQKPAAFSERQYPTQIKYMPVPKLAAADCLVVTWVTNRHNPLCFVKKKLYPSWSGLLSCYVSMRSPDVKVPPVPDRKLIVSVPCLLHSHKPPLDEVLKDYIKPGLCSGYHRGKLPESGAWEPRPLLAPCVPCSCNNHSDVCDPETGQCLTALSIPTVPALVGALQAIMATLVQQVAAARSVTVTPKALSTVTATTHLDNVFASQEPRDSAVRNAGQDSP